MNIPQFIYSLIASVNWRSLPPIQHQQESPVWGAVKGQRDYSMQTELLWHSMVRGNSRGLAPLCSGGWDRLIFLVPQFPWCCFRQTNWVLDRNWTWVHQRKRSGLTWRTSPAPGPWLVHSNANKYSKSSRCIGLKSTILISWELGVVNPKLESPLCPCRGLGSHILEPILGSCGKKTKRGLASGIGDGEWGGGGESPGPPSRLDDLLFRLAFKDFC